MSSRPLAALALALLGAAATPCFALEAFKLYDNFDAPLIDQAKWPGFPERVRNIVGKKAHLQARDYGGLASNTGVVGTSTNMNLPDPTKVTEMRATITVTAVQPSGCATNTAATKSRARIYGDFFNIGTPTAGSQLHDVSAQVRVIRASDSTDAAGVLKVEGSVFLCNDAACANTTTIGVAEMGTVATGTPVTVQMQWDKPNKRFLFVRDTAAQMSVVYTQSDLNPPGAPNANISLRNEVPNCMSTPRPSGYVDATFENLYVNTSAAP